MKIKKNDVFNFIFIFLVISYTYLRTLGIENKIYLIVYVICLYLLMCLKIISTKITKKEFFRIIIFLIISTFSIIVVDEVDLAIPIIAAITLLREDHKKIIKNFLIISIMWYSFILILNFLGVLESALSTRVLSDEVRIRSSLGFIHPNSPFLFFLPILFCLYALYSSKKTFINILTILISLFLYKLTDCRTGFYCFLIFIFIYNFNFIIKNKMFYKILKWMFLIFTILSITVAYKYGDDGNTGINRILTLRPFYIREYLQQGNVINISGGNFIKNKPLDNIYVYLLIEKGIIIYLTYLFIHMYSLKIYKDSIEYKTIIFVYLIYGLFEAYTIWPAINFMMILQIKDIILQKKGVKNE